MNNRPGLLGLSACKGSLNCVPEDCQLISMLRNQVQGHSKGDNTQQASGQEPQLFNGLTASGHGIWFPKT